MICLHLTKYYPTSPCVLCGGNQVRFIDPDGRAPWGNENIRDARTFASTSEPGYEVKLIDGKYGQDAQVVQTSTGKVVYEKPATPSNQRSAIGNICSLGRADGFNIGTTTTTDVRAVADLCEGISDACDAVGTGLLITGVGAGAALYKAGTIAGYMSDGINIVVDVYEGKYQNGIERMTANIASWVISNKINTKNNEVDMFLQKAVDKLLDSIINNVTKDE